MELIVPTSAAASRLSVSVGTHASARPVPVVSCMTCVKCHARGVTLHVERGMSRSMGAQRNSIGGRCILG